MVASRANKLLNQAVAAHQQGDFNRANALYEKVLALNPKDADALHLLGGIALQQGRLEHAQTQIERALSIRPEDALFHANLAAVFVAQQRYERALIHAEKAVAANPQIVEGWNALGTARAYQGGLVEAERAYLRVLQLQPRHSESHNNLGNVLKSQGRTQEAEKHYRQAVSLAPKQASAQNNLGALLLSQARYEEAQQALTAAVRNDTTMAAAWNNLGQALQAQGKLKEAEAAYGEALKLEPDQVLWQYRRTLACPIIGESVKRIGYWRKGLLRQLKALPKLDVQAYFDQLATSHTEPPYHLAYQGFDNFEIKREIAKKCVNVPHYFTRNMRHNHEKPRVGVVVTAGHEGIFDACSRGLFSHWQYEAAELVLCASSALCQNWQKVMPKLEVCTLQGGLETHVERLKAAKFDVLYFWEVGSDALNYYLARLKLAPIQATSWGTPESTALDEMDLYISCQGWRDGCEDERFSERVAVLSRVPMVYEPPILGNPVTSNLFDIRLKGTRHAYVCAQNLFKLHPDFDGLIKGILQQDLQALVYLVEGKQKHWTVLLRQRLQKFLGKHAERVKFLPRLTYGDYLQLILQADCLLDSPHFSGGNTSFEALSLGAPIVTIAGTLGRSRFTTACYQQMEFMDLVTFDAPSYIAKAVQLASDDGYRNAVRQELSSRTDMLIRQTKVAEDFQRALIQSIV